MVDLSEEADELVGRAVHSRLPFVQRRRNPVPAPHRNRGGRRSPGREWRLSRAGEARSTCPGLTHVRPDLLVQVSEGALGTGIHYIESERSAVLPGRVGEKLGPYHRMATTGRPLPLLVVCETDQGGMYSAMDQSSSDGGSLRPDCLRDSGTRCANPLDPSDTPSFAFPNSFERKLANIHLQE